MCTVCMYEGRTCTTVYHTGVGARQSLSLLRQHRRWTPPKPINIAAVHDRMGSHSHRHQSYCTSISYRHHELQPCAQDSEVRAISRCLSFLSVHTVVEYFPLLTREANPSHVAETCQERSLVGTQAPVHSHRRSPTRGCIMRTNHTETYLASAKNSLYCIGSSHDGIWIHG